MLMHKLLLCLASLRRIAALEFSAQRKCPIMLEALRMALDQPGIVVDIGANGGCEMNAALHHGRHVIGVECLASAYQELLSYEPISQHPNASLLHICAGRRTGMTHLLLASDSSSLYAENVAGGKERKKAASLCPEGGCSSSALKSATPKVGGAVLRQAVVLVPLDDIVQESRVAVIKVDTQGSEFEALLGMLNTIRRDRPVIVYEDVNRAGWKKSGDVERDLLRPLGYKCHRASDVRCAVP